MRFVMITLAAATLSPLTSYAVLGGAPMSGASSAISLRASPSAASTNPSTSSTAAYSVHESRDADGIKLRNLRFRLHVGRD